MPSFVYYMGCGFMLIAIYAFYGVSFIFFRRHWKEFKSRFVRLALIGLMAIFLVLLLFSFFLAVSLMASLKERFGEVGPIDTLSLIASLIICGRAATLVMKEYKKSSILPLF